MRYLVHRYQREADLPNLKIDDPTVNSLLTSYFGNAASPSLERLSELSEEKLERFWLQQAGTDPTLP